jgi:hypothetical protein
MHALLQANQLVERGSPNSDIWNPCPCAGREDVNHYPLADSPLVQQAMPKS